MNIKNITDDIINNGEKIILIDSKGDATILKKMLQILKKESKMGMKSKKALKI